MAGTRWRRTEPPVRLTQRQFVAVALYASGASAQQTAEILGVQFGTLHKLLRRIRSKFACAGLAAGTRTDLERALYAHPTLVAYADGTERLVRPYVPAAQQSGA